MKPLEQVKISWPTFSQRTRRNTTAYVDLMIGNNWTRIHFWPTLDPFSNAPSSHARVVRRGNDVELLVTMNGNLTAVTEVSRTPAPTQSSGTH